MAPATIQLLGDVAITDDAGEHRVLARRQPRTVLAFLVMERHRSVMRSELADPPVGGGASRPLGGSGSRRRVEGPCVHRRSRRRRVAAQHGRRAPLRHPTGGHRRRRGAPVDRRRCRRRAAGRARQLGAVRAHRPGRACRARRPTRLGDPSPRSGARAGRHGKVDRRRPRGRPPASSARAERARPDRRGRWAWRCCGRCSSGPRRGRPVLGRVSPRVDRRPRRDRGPRRARSWHSTSSIGGSGMSWTSPPPRRPRPSPRRSGVLGAGPRRRPPRTAGRSWVAVPSWIC
jgi:hypothetical protein